MIPGGAVSVIITSYNQRELLAEAIDSVLDQTVEPGEIIVVDAASTDGSPAMIERYARKYPDLVKPILLDKDPGLPQTRNLALESVGGEYVSILDGDDRYVAERIERELETLSSAPDLAAVYSNYYITDVSGNRIGQRYDGPQPTGNIFPDVFGGKFGMLRSMTIEYDALESIGFLDESFWHYDGFDMTVELSKDHRIDYIDELLTEYRLHGGGAAEWRTVEDELPELRGIFEKHEADLTRLSPSERLPIENWWNAHLSILEAHLARDKKQYRRALTLYLDALRTDYRSVVSLENSLDAIVPGGFSTSMKAWYHRNRHHRT